MPTRKVIKKGYAKKRTRRPGGKGKPKKRKKKH